jgi:hypothetical protein
MTWCQEKNLLTPQEEAGACQVRTAACNSPDPFPARRAMHVDPVRALREE